MNNEMTLAAAEVESDIRQTIEQWRKAAAAADIDGIMKHYAPDIVSFDAVSQLRFKGADAYRKHWAACMEMCKGPMIFEISELEVAAAEELAFAYYLIRCGTMEDGREKASWMRGTACLRRLGGKWLIVHEHFSVPFDMQSGKAMFELQP